MWKNYWYTYLTTSILLDFFFHSSQLNKAFVEPAPAGLMQQHKSMQDTLKHLKSLQLARSLENDTQR